MVPDAEQRLLKACVELDDYMLSNASCMASVQRTLARPPHEENGDSQPHPLVPVDGSARVSEPGETVQEALDKEVQDVIFTLKRVATELPHLHIVLRALQGTGAQERAARESESEDEDV